MKEKGFISVYLLCMILILQMISFGFFCVIQREKTILTVFCDGTQAQALAEEGAQKAYLRLSENTELLAAIKNKKNNLDKSVKILQEEEVSVENGKYAVSALYDTDKEEFLLMGTGQFGKQTGQVFLHTFLTAQGDLKIDRWER